MEAMLKKASVNSLPNFGWNEKSPAMRGRALEGISGGLSRVC